MKKLCTAAILLLALLVPGICAREAVFNGEEYGISAVYNETAFPGDAVFVRLHFSQGLKKGRAARTDFSDIQATLEFLAEGNVCRTADFFTLSKNTRASRTLLAGVPLSTWWTAGMDCAVRVTYRLGGQKSMAFELPFSLKEKEFISETLNLNQSNSDIKTDTSVKRMEQIKKLNGILETSDPSAVYQTKPFIPPTPASRRTSFFADRRVYKYTNGKSSTSLHYGIDYGIPEGSAVGSCADGKVVLAEMRNSTGWSVVVEHLPGLYSLYYHMSELKVKEGDMVKAAQILGLSGATGLATGPHLHWEMRLNGEAVSPDFFTSDFAFASEN